MKKIIVGKNEGIAEVIDAILNEPDSEVTLVIPNGSVLGASMRNFHLLKREVEAAEKTVAIESVDETILAFAKESRIEASHPLWRGIRGSGNGVSDIVPKSVASPHRKTKAPAAAAPAPQAMDNDEPIDDESTDDDEEFEKEELEEAEREERSPFFSRMPFGRRRHTASMVRPTASVSAADDDAEDDHYDADDDGDDNNGPRSGSRGKWITGILVAVIVLLGGAYIASAYFNHATVTIDFKKTPWTNQLTLTADKSASADNLAGNVIAAQIFTSNKDLAESFPGSSVQQVAQKAQGMITIYNDYSTKPQELVATTRFLTPDGKIFRITQNVNVPGATMSGGKLVPSSITVPIVADQAGPDYNIGPVAKLSVPGFAGKPQESGFYGTITASTTGGFIGQRATPTAADITAAKASTTALLNSALQGGFSGSYPNNFKILDGATQTEVTKLTVNTSTDSNGNFTVFGEATLQAIGFDETALKNDLLAQAQSQEANSVFADINLNYSSVTANFAKGTLSFTVSAQGDLEPQLSVATLQGSILGKNINEARAAISQLPQLNHAEISIWPSWLSTIPSDPEKVKISIN